MRLAEVEALPAPEFYAMAGWLALEAEENKRAMDKAKGGSDKPLVSFSRPPKWRR